MLRAAGLLTGIVLAAVGARAEVLAAYSGYSFLGAPCADCASFVNFAVYQNTDGNWTDDAFFDGIAPTALADLDEAWGDSVDTIAPFVFLYQVVNSKEAGVGGPLSLRTFAVSRDLFALPTSAGLFSGAVFLDEAGNPVTGGPPGDYAIADPDPSLAEALDTPDDGEPAARGVRPVGIALDAGAFDPTSARSGALISNPDVDGGASQFPSVLFDWGADGEIDSCPPEEDACASSVFFVTGFLVPAFLWAESEPESLPAEGGGAAGDVAFLAPGGFPGCRSAERNRITINRKGGRIQWKWSWREGDATTKADFGAPTETDEYATYLFDAVGGVHVVVGSAPLLTGASWRETKSGFRYRSTGGVRKVRMKEGEQGDASIKLKGKGFPFPMTPLVQDPEMIIQFINLTNGNCWESRFDAPARANDEKRFKDD